jgi:uncharacterized protein (TIGR03067 family)
MSMARSFIVASAALLLLGAQRQQDAAQQELKRLAGTWLIAAMEVEGEKIADERLQGTELEIKENKYIVTVKGKSHETVITLDPTKKPKEIDMVFRDGPNKDKVHRGIYELQGDTFRFCRSRDPDFERPKEFKTSPGTGLFLVEWKRQQK